MKQSPVRSSRPKLHAELIVDAAISRVDRHGLEELSARKLAQDLGCEAMSLYHHFGSMEALKDAVVDRLLGSIVPADSPEPIGALKREAESYLALAEAHALAFQLVATRRWKGEGGAQTAARAVAHFIALGFGPQAALARARTLGAYLNGAGLALAAWTTAPDAPKKDADRVKTDLSKGLGMLLRTLAEPRPSVE